MRDTGRHLEGPARLHWRLRQALADANARYQDEVLQAPHAASQLGNAKASGLPAGLLEAVRKARYRGVLAGHEGTTRIHLAATMVRQLAQPGLVLTTDSASEHRWQRALTRAGVVSACHARRVRDAASHMHWLGGRHDVLVVDSPELMQHAALEQALEGSAALARIGFSTAVDWRQAVRWGKGLGPLVSVLDVSDLPRRQQIRVPMPNDVAVRYAAAWDTFLAAYDRFVAMRGDAGFGTFVAQARTDSKQRPALRAWHDALRCAAWHESKASVVRDLLSQHRGAQIALFTPDRQCAYELAREHLVAAVTAELSRRERSGLLDAFAAGTLRVLAGPKLLDTGIQERSANVGVLIGGGYGARQRNARCQRVATDGQIYELVSQDTVEVSRANRIYGQAAQAPAVLHLR